MLDGVGRIPLIWEIHCITNFMNQHVIETIQAVPAISVTISYLARGHNHTKGKEPIKANKWRSYFYTNPTVLWTDCNIRYFHKSHLKVWTKAIPLPAFSSSIKPSITKVYKAEIIQQTLVLCLLATGLLTFFPIILLIFQNSYYGAVMFLFFKGVKETSMHVCMYIFHFN